LGGVFHTFLLNSLGSFFLWTLQESNISFPILMFQFVVNFTRIEGVIIILMLCSIVNFTRTKCFILFSNASFCCEFHKNWTRLCNALFAFNYLSIFFVVLCILILFCCLCLFNKLGGKGFGFLFCCLANQLCALQENMTFQKVQLD